MPTSRVILHLDLDAFFASVEQRDHPAWKGRPVIVGIPAAERGVVCAASYEARTHGVHAAMPSAVARRLCPQAIWTRPRMAAYAEESARVMQILNATGALVEQTSVDEAYLDLTASCPGTGPDESLRHAIPIAQHLKSRIAAERRLTASAGIGSNKLLAKIASDSQKPDGLTLISETAKLDFLSPLSVRVLPGVGRVTEKLLRRAGIRSVGDLQSWQGDLGALLGSLGPQLKAFARGEDDRPVEPIRERKSFSTEKTFAADTQDRSLIFSLLWQQAEDLANGLTVEGLLAGAVEVNVRYTDFSTHGRQITLPDPTDETKILYWHACLLLDQNKLLSRPIRRLGPGVGRLADRPARQLTLL